MARRRKTPRGPTLSTPLSATLTRELASATNKPPVILPKSKVDEEVPVATTFHRFLELPKEIQLYIWCTILEGAEQVASIAAMRRGGRKIFTCLTPLPALLHVCTNSRNEALKVFPKQDEPSSVSHPNFNSHWADFYRGNSSDSIYFGPEVHKWDVHDFLSGTNLVHLDKIKTIAIWHNVFSQLAGYSSSDKNFHDPLRHFERLRKLERIIYVVRDVRDHISDPVVFEKIYIRHRFSYQAQLAEADAEVIHTTVNHALSKVKSKHPDFQKPYIDVRVINRGPDRVFSSKLTYKTSAVDRPNATSMAFKLPEEEPLDMWPQHAIPDKQPVAQNKQVAIPGKKVTGPKKQAGSLGKNVTGLNEKAISPNTKLTTSNAPKVSNRSYPVRENTCASEAMFKTPATNEPHLLIDFEAIDEPTSTVPPFTVEHPVYRKEDWPVLSTPTSTASDLTPKVKVIASTTPEGPVISFFIQKGTSAKGGKRNVKDGGVGRNPTENIGVVKQHVKSPDQKPKVNEDGHVLPHLWSAEYAAKMRDETVKEKVTSQQTVIERNQSKSQIRATPAVPDITNNKLVIPEAGSDEYVPPHLRGMDAATRKRLANPREPLSGKSMVILGPRRT